MTIEVATAYISILPSTDKLAPAIREAFGSVGRDAEREGEQSGDGYAGGFKNALTAAVGIGSGLLLGAGVADGFSQALDQGAMNAKLSASLGLTSAESARAGKVAGDLYKSNFGDSVETVNTALKGVIQNIDGMRGASESTLSAISAKVLTTADVFDQDLGGVTRGVGQMLRTGLAKDADQALDILTAGFQSGADKSEDFLDTLNEYGTQFRKLGINGKTATGLISQGLKAGARDGDLVADSLKEFSIRAIDGSKSTADGFKALGLDASTMATKIGKGGTTAAAGLGETLKRLRGIKDPIARSAAAVSLFGTQSEDLGEALFALDPRTAVKSLGKVAGAAQRASDAVGATPDAQIKTFTRTLQQGLVSVLGGQVIPKMTEFGGALKANLGTVAPVLATVTTGLVAYKVATLASAAVTAIQTAGTVGATGAQWSLNAALRANPIGLVITGLTGLATGLVIAYKKSATFRAIVNGAFAAVKSGASALWSVLKSVFGKVSYAFTHFVPVGIVIANFGKIVSFVRGLPGKITSAASGMWDGIKTAFKSSLNWVIQKWNGLRFSMPSIDTHIPGVGTVGGFSVGVPRIPLLAKGGVLTKATLNVAGEAGPEAVTPLSYLDKRIASVAKAAASTAQAAPARLSGPVRLVVDGAEFAAYVEDRAGAVYSNEAAFAARIGRMRFA